VQSALYKASEPQEIDNLVMAIQSVWRTAERGEWTAESEGDLADELHSVEWVQPICTVPCSRLVSVL
jgi:hypothetical protein